jgi:hypothetical protein
LNLKQFNKHNFHKYTFCIFKEVCFDVIENLKQNYSSKSGSSYYFTDEGLYRVSNHWGRAANCRWKLDSSSMIISKSNNNKVGFAKWSDFYPNNEQENLFYIQVDYDLKKVDFQHKNNPTYETKFLCRNALETAKRIKICKEVLIEDSWYKYLQFNCIENFRIEIINELLTTNNSFIAIKRKYTL